MVKILGLFILVFFWFLVFVLEIVMVKIYCVILWNVKLIVVDDFSWFGFELCKFFFDLLNIFVKKEVWLYFILVMIFVGMCGIFFLFVILVEVGYVLCEGGELFCVFM